MRIAVAFCIWLIPLVASLSQEPAEIPSHADLAFEQKDWSLAIRNYQAVLESDSLNGHAWLRIAQAQRALGLYVQALKTLESAFIVGAREAMIEFERARNFANLGRTEDSLVALSRANESGLRALSSLEGAEEFKTVRLRRWKPLLQPSLEGLPPQILAAAHGFRFCTLGNPEPCR